MTQGPQLYEFFVGLLQGMKNDLGFSRGAGIKVEELQDFGFKPFGLWGLVG